MAEILEGWAEVAGFPVRLGFRVASASRLAGGPVDIDFLAAATGDHPVHLGVAGDRARQRPAWFSFRATYNGVPLADPRAAWPEEGGPATTALLTPTSPYSQRLSLAEFVALEDTASSDGTLVVGCRRRPHLGWSGIEAIRDQQDPVEVELRLDLRMSST